MGTEAMKCCGALTKVYSDAGNRKHLPNCGETATLIIGSWSSECGKCGKEVLPSEETHHTVSGYGDNPAGCGVRFDRITSCYHYPGIKERCLEMRPDLPWVDYGHVV